MAYSEFSFWRAPGSGLLTVNSQVYTCYLHVLIPTLEIFKKNLSQTWGWPLPLSGYATDNDVISSFGIHMPTVLPPCFEFNVCYCEGPFVY